jgi:hypothetical protein
MTTPLPPESTMKDAPDLRTGTNTLAKVSFLLALVSVLAALPSYLWVANSDPVLWLPEGVAPIVVVGALVLGVAATVTGILALDRSRHYARGRALTQLAIAGLLLGLGNAIVLLCGSGIYAVCGHGC